MPHRSTNPRAVSKHSRLPKNARLSKRAPKTTARARRHPSRPKPRQATLLGVGSYVPPQVIDNHYFRDTLALDTTAEWIHERIGIRERHWASADESASDLATEAARVALTQAGLTPHDIDLVIVATSSPDYVMPSTACLVQAKLGADRAAAFDLVNACAGFVYALDASTRYLQSGDMQHVLVIGVDLGSRLVSHQDRGTCVFFGDGAGAVVLGAEGPGRVLASKFQSRGVAEPLHLPVGGTMRMDGRAVWQFATEVLPQTVRELCEQAHVAPSDLRLLVPHQANRNILAASAEAVGLPLERVAMNIERYGNTLAASVPIALDEALASAAAEPGDLVALVGFGAGLTWGGLLLQL